MHHNYILFTQIDLHVADIPKVIEQLNNAFGFEENEVIQVPFLFGLIY